MNRGSMHDLPIRQRAHLSPLHPWDAHNKKLYANVHPLDWCDPDPAPRYNLVVIGGGTAGLVTAAGAAGLGAKVALIERHLLGGDCLNVGCVPSKALVRAARAAAEVRHAARFGVNVAGDMTVNFPAVMERMRRLRANISQHDSAARFKALGVDVFIGNGTFTAPDAVEVNGRILRFTKAVIATGARAAVPQIPGLSEIPFLTNETLFSLTQLPRRFAVIGAGPIGCEMAQTFARLGSEVHLIDTHSGILPREDRDAAAIVQASLIRDGVKLLASARHLRFSLERGGIGIHLESQDRDCTFTADQVLVAVGRTPNLERLGLEVAGVAFEKRGIVVDDQLRTTNASVYACGDVCSRYQFTHAADFMARAVIQNALFKGRKRVSSLIVPWSTYTSPEVAHVGLYEHEAKARGIAVQTFTQELSQVDRAILDGEDEGFVRVHVRAGTDQIVGATVVAAHAGEMIGELSLAMSAKVGLRAIGAAIHPYPTQAEAIRKLGDLYNRSRLTPFIRRVLGRWLMWQRRG
jgi:pyruvate/2-oxoglutarate dehydrogenase complex dihydrolipoamide dehydrogenase (E3) component